jgi:hypothetical protein
MENFECKAPMYVNFVESSVLDKNYDADKSCGKYKCWNVSSNVSVLLCDVLSLMPFLHNIVNRNWHGWHNSYELPVTEVTVQMQIVLCDLVGQIF